MLCSNSSFSEHPQNVQNQRSQTDVNFSLPEDTPKATSSLLLNLTLSIWSDQDKLFYFVENRMDWIDEYTHGAVLL